MPELPEVETVRRGLEPVLLGAQFVEVEVRRAGLRRPFPSHLAERLTGRRVIGLRRRAKYLLMDLDGGDALLLHLGMSGRLLLTPARPNALSPHDHLILYTESGMGVRLNDARRFGSLDWIEPGAEAEHPRLRELGPEPLSDDFSVQNFFSVLSRSAAAIKSLMLDQRRVAGIGNIYACEALYGARIHPFRPAKSLTQEEVSRLVPAVRTVLAAAIEAGGASLRDHRQPKGELGYFQHQFQVYGRTGAPCFRCGDRAGAFIQRSVQSGRSSFFCATCQH